MNHSGRPDRRAFGTSEHPRPTHDGPTAAFAAQESQERPRRLLGGPSRSLKRGKTQGFLMFRAKPKKKLSTASQGPPRTSQDPPRRTPGGAAQSGPGGHQGTHTMAQTRPRKDQEQRRSTQEELPRAPQDQPLGGENVEIPCVFLVFLKKYLFEDKKSSKVILEPFWTDLGSQNGQQGPQEPPKKAQEALQRSPRWL